MAIRAGFVTCVQLGLECMQAIYEAGGSLACAATLEDSMARGKSGRVFLDEFCGARGIPLHKSRGVNQPETVRFLQEMELDWLFIIGWSQIARADVLRSTRHGVIGIHPTLLPEGRGRAAVPWAILKGLTRTGVTMFVLDEGVDSGPLLGQVVIPVGDDETATTLYTKVAAAHRDLIMKVWPSLADGSAQAIPQDDARATYWPGRTPEDGRITPAMSCADAERLVRAVTHPYPGAFIDLAGERLRIWSGRVAAPGADHAPGTRRLVLADGSYDAESFSVEPLP